MQSSLIEDIKRSGDIFQKLLYAGKIQEAQGILNKFFQTLKSPSWEARKEVADNLPEVLKTLDETSKDKKIFRQAHQFLLGAMEQEKDEKVLFSMAASLSSVANRLIAGDKFIEGLEIMEGLGNSRRLRSDPLFEREKSNIFPKEALLNVLTTLGERNAEEREAIFRTMGKLGTLAIEPLLEVLAAEKSIQIRAKLVKTISSIGEAAVDFLVPALSDPRWFVVRNMASILGETKSVKALEALIIATQHDEPKVRKEAYIALSKIPSDRSRQSIVNAFGDVNDGVLASAVDLATKLELKETFPSLLKMVRKSEPYQLIELQTRTKAILAFGKLAPERAFNELAGILEKKRLLATREPTEIRVSATLALGFSDNKKAMELLQQLYKKDPKPEISEAAKRAIAMINSRIAKEAKEKTPTWENRRHYE